MQGPPKPRWNYFTIGNKESLLFLPTHQPPPNSVELDMETGMPEVVAIFTTGEPGGSLLSVAEATLERGKGLVGDRYYNGKGTFSHQLKFSRDWEITLIESEEIERFNSLELFAFSPAEFRRNILTSGVRLNGLVDRRFSVGSAVLAGIRLCEPCAHLAKFIGPASVKSLAHRAGLRARILSGGVVRPGDRITEP